MWLEALRDLSLWIPTLQQLHGEADEFIAIAVLGEHRQRNARKRAGVPRQGPVIPFPIPYSLFPVPYFSRPHPRKRLPLRWCPSKSLLQSHQRSDRNTAAI